MNRSPVIALALAAAVSAHAGMTDSQPLQAFPGTDNVPNGDDRSELVRRRYSLKIHVETSGLDPESPYTLWAVVFDNPEYCHTEPCTEADLPVSPGHDPRVDASIVFAGGGISEADGTGRFLGRVRTIRGEMTGARLFGTGTLDPRHAEIHVVVRGHRQPPPEALFAAISSFDGGCTADNVCEDQQFAIHEGGRDHWHR